MFFTSYFYKLSMNIFFQLIFKDMELPAFWSSVSDTVKFCTFSIPSQESVVLLWFIDCMFLVVVFSSLDFIKAISFVYFGSFVLVFLFFFVLATKSCYQTPFFFTAAVKNNWKQSQQDLEHCYSDLFKNKKKMVLWHFCIYIAKFNWWLLKQ